MTERKPSTAPLSVTAPELAAAVRIAVQRRLADHAGVSAMQRDTIARSVAAAVARRIRRADEDRQ